MAPTKSCLRWRRTARLSWVRQSGRRQSLHQMDHPGRVRHWTRRQAKAALALCMTPPMKK